MFGNTFCLAYELCKALNFLEKGNLLYWKIIPAPYRTRKFALCRNHILQSIILRSHLGRQSLCHKTSWKKRASIMHWKSWKIMVLNYLLGKDTKPIKKNIEIERVKDIFFKIRATNVQSIRPASNWFFSFSIHALLALLNYSSLPKTFRQNTCISLESRLGCQETKTYPKTHTSQICKNNSLHSRKKEYFRLCA